MMQSKESTGYHGFFASKEDDDKWKVLSRGKSDDEKD